MGVPAKDTRFLRKLYLLLGTEDASIISWSHDGSMFSIFDPAALQKIMKTKYNLSSMCTFRQNLRAFGFAELIQTPHSTQSTDRRPTGAVPEMYYHKFFARGRPADLEKIGYDASGKFRCHKCRRRPNEAGTKCSSYTVLPTHFSSKSCRSRANPLPDTAVQRTLPLTARVVGTAPSSGNSSSSVRSGSPVNRRVSSAKCKRGSLKVHLLMGSTQGKSLSEDDALMKVAASMGEQKRPVDCSVVECSVKRMRVSSNPVAGADLTAHSVLQPIAQRTLSSVRPSIIASPSSRVLLPQTELTDYLGAKNRGVDSLPSLVDVLSATVYEYAY